MYYFSPYPVMEIWIPGLLGALPHTRVALIIPDGAHHLDLRATTAYDPPNFVTVHVFEIKLIADWIQEADQMRKHGAPMRSM